MPACAAPRTNAVRHYDDSGVRRRHYDGDGSSRSRSAAELALEGRGGSSPRTRSCDGSSSARLLTEAVSVLAVRHSDDGSRACVIDDDGSCSTQQHGDEDSAMQ